MTDWSHLGVYAEASFEEHRQSMVAHFIALRIFDAELARASIANYIGAPGCPFPGITDDIKAAWSALPQATKLRASTMPEPASSRRF